MVRWCNGNMADCRSAVTGSTPVRTANCRMVQRLSISAFDAEDVGSNPAPATFVGFSLTGKVPHCECGEQGSSPGVNQDGNWLEVDS
jgi:hypothetical protein